ncbi:Type-I restriction modification system methylase [Desulfonema limicola]|uniref:Type-I restriction modification system methylase n=2 Tax=Desulfonema limicola TaxID=45656 RepID=A0A975B658_9BACT|nr:Type-I restriction modification system methylase [Desulfonema limicola]
MLTESYLVDILEFYNGKEPVFSEGEFTVYGSNGVIGFSEQFNHHNAIILGRVGAYCGSVDICENKFWASDNTIIVQPKNGFDLRYIYYRLLSTPLNSYAGGAAQPLITHSILKSIKIKITNNINTQKRIADILSAYDDLIENNRRRIALLEQAARLLYREWFVYLRFPGHEKVKVVDGVPEGWRKSSLAEVLDSIKYGYTASAQIEAIGPKFLRITDIVPEIINWDSVPHCVISESDFKKFHLKTGDIVVARTGATVGYAKRIDKIEHKAIFASYLVRLRFNEQLDNLFAGIYIESPEYKAFIQNNCGGAAQPNANAKIISSAQILIPPKSYQLEFRNYLEPLYKQRNVLQKQNQRLTKARDLLLPRLMNGEIKL